MTSLIAWAGMDPNGQTSLYFATDSRISWSVQPPFWDCGRKVFACRTEPDIFAFTGDGLFAVTVISRLCSLIDDGLVLESTRSSFTTRCQWVFNFINDSLQKYPKAKITPFTIFYGTRIGEGTNPNSLLRQKTASRSDYDVHLGSWFGCHAITWDGSNLVSESLEVPQNRSQYIAVDGSGKRWVQDHQGKTADDPQCGTSRIIFRAFCNALSASGDAQSGGYPQLVGLYRSMPAKSFGIVKNGHATYLGVCGDFAGLNVEWRNEDFERVDIFGVKIKGAKKHGFNFSKI